MCPRDHVSTRRPTVATTATRRSRRVGARDTPSPFWLDGGWVVGGSLVLGGLTSFAQGMLPDPMRSLANSPSGWTLLTVVMICLRRPRLLPAACLGAISFVFLVLGYTAASEFRGLSYDPLLWGAIGLFTGPAIGWSTAAFFDRRPSINAVGSSLIAGVAITDAIYGLTMVSGTTSPVYWSIAGAAGVLVLVVVAVHRRLRGRHLAAQGGLTLLWVVAGTAAFAVLNGM